jgi:ADP-ribosylglycohydrolase
MKEHYPGWGRFSAIVGEEFKQSLEEGKDPAAIEALRPLLEKAGGNSQLLENLHQRLLDLPLRADFPFREPSGLEEIRAARDLSRAPRLAPRVADDTLLDQLHGAWLGRCAGCALGKPVEGYMGSDEKFASWERQKAFLTALDPAEWPLRDYFPGASPAEAQVGKLGCPDSTRERIAFMETDDDIRYTVLGQVILRKHGLGFSTWDVAAAWINHLPYRQVCTAETQAYRNLAILGGFHSWRERVEYDEADWHWVAHHLNPYREWIGAQIRIDSYGYAAPGNPELAAELAWRDARLSHVKNGIYGAMFCAAMIAAAFATSDVGEIIEAGLAQIPATGRLHAETRQVIALCARHGNRPEAFEDVFREIYALLGHYHPVHTNNNAALCVAALLLSGGDFHHGITLAVMGGWDTDCNGATVGSIVGAIARASGAPAHWTARLNDTLRSAIIDYHPIAISECARRSWEIVRDAAA